ncbi:MAG: HigA family addiction module antitoxin [Pseudomonadota bacterium]
MKKYGSLSLLDPTRPNGDKETSVDWEPYSPGNFIKSDILDFFGISQGELAARLGVSRRSVNELVSGKRGVSTEMAYRLSKLTGQTPEYWLRLQMHRDLWEARRFSPEPWIEPLTVKD